MRGLPTFLLLLYLLAISSSQRVMVKPSCCGKFPISDWITWPESTSKVAITVQCPNHKTKVKLKTPDNSNQGFVELYGKNRDISVYCREAGRKNWYSGEIWFYRAGNSGPCKGAVGSTDTLIVEWTQEGVKLMRDEEIILSQTWGLTGGNCLKKTAYWRVQNYGSTVISAESVLGINNDMVFRGECIFSSSRKKT